MIQNKPQRPNVEVNKKKKNSAYINFLADRPKLASQCSHCLKVAKSDRNLSKRLYYCSATMIIQIYSFEWVLQLLIQLSFSHFFFLFFFATASFYFYSDSISQRHFSFYGNTFFVVVTGWRSPATTTTKKNLKNFFKHRTKIFVHNFRYFFCSSSVSRGCNFSEIKADDLIFTVDRISDAIIGVNRFRVFFFFLNSSNSR